MKSPILKLRRALAVGITAGMLLSSSNAIAAEQVVLKYKILREKISVQELTRLTETGTPSPALATYLKLAGKSPEDIRQPLTQVVKVNPRLLDRVLNSWAGNAVLDQISPAIHTPSNQANRQALRAALTLSASPDGKLTLMEVLQNYPTQEVEVEGDRLVGAYRQLSRLSDRLENLLNRGRFF
ncbi:alpha/beta hydrolase [Trichocoleus desertorum AS-A10]|uniref:alpha/beta hydrolase n=1 Tax=Trichocoleus desertorum TaxID=1481672 RepID=UPI003298D2B7